MQVIFEVLRCPSKRTSVYVSVIDVIVKLMKHTHCEYSLHERRVPVLGIRQDRVLIQKHIDARYAVPLVSEEFYSR